MDRYVYFVEGENEEKVVNTLILISFGEEPFQTI